MLSLLSLKVRGGPCSSVGFFSVQGMPQIKLFVRHSPPEMPQLKQGTPQNLPATFSEASFERGQGQEMAPLLQTTPESPPKTPQNGETLPSLAAILQHKNAAIPQGFLLSPHLIGMMPPF